MHKGFPQGLTQAYTFPGPVQGADPLALRVRGRTRSAGGLRRWLGLGTTLGMLGGQTDSHAASMAAPTAKPWKFTLSAAVKESFDSNVYLQSLTDQANQESFLTSLLPQIGMAYARESLSWRLNYSPEITFFHAEPSEDFVAHRTTGDLSLKGEGRSFDATASWTWIDGSSIGPTWTGPGGAPATGGPAIRDRRDSAVYRASLRYTQQLGEWFVRPVLTGYLHDFMTEHRSTPGYQNYVDRNEFTVGADFGREAKEKLPVWLGYRFGQQDQAALLQFPEQYDNHFHRLLFGVDGAVAPWLRGSVTLGPEFRTYADTVPASFGSLQELNLFVEASVTLIPSKHDTLTLTLKQFEQPGFSGRSTYEDLTLDCSWRHRFGKQWTVGAGGRAYNTDFLDPVKRNDWVLSLNALLNWAVTSRLSAEASYLFETGDTRDANAAGREYDRHLIALGLKYSFR